jgi:hypothetical protein
MRTPVAWWLGRGPSPPEFQELFVEPFNAGPDGIRLDVRVLTTAALEQTVAAVAAGAGPDIVMVPRTGDFLALAAAASFGISRRTRSGSGGVRACWRRPCAWPCWAIVCTAFPAAARR